MGGRYYLTGVQLGMLMSIPEESVRMKLLQEIMDNQYLGDKEEFDKLTKKTKNTKEKKK